MLPDVRSTPNGDSCSDARASGQVVTYTPDENQFCCEHERATRAEVARRLARLKGLAFAGDWQRDGVIQPGTYYVPGDTLIGELEARRLGICSRDDLFGGVVPFAFVATKAITHPLISGTARAPLGWSDRFAREVAGSVHDGWSAFSADDAMQAGERLLARGPARVKAVRATGGRGQWVVADRTSLARCLEAIDRSELAGHGVVIEANLDEVETFSVGQVWVGELTASYHGVQRLTRDNQGEPVYGGSTLHVVRGGFDALLASVSDPDVRTAVEQASSYHAAALECFPGMLVSRINYDVARGRDADGCWRSGVLEQSWRLGGASGAEVAALEHFQAHPEARTVTSAGYEVFGLSTEPPADATVYFRGNDPRVGWLTKYARIEDDRVPVAGH